MNLIYLGKLVSTHGINGELKLLSSFEKKEKALKPGMKFYINDVEYILKSSRPHKQYDLVKLNEYSNINEVLFLVGLNVYINKDDLNLDENEYLLEDLIGAKVMDNEEYLGNITEVLLSGKNNLVRVKSLENEFLIPLIPAYIKEFNLKEKVLYTINGKDLKL